MVSWGDGYLQFCDLMSRGRYKNLLLTLTDDPAQVEATLLEFRDASSEIVK